MKKVVVSLCFIVSMVIFGGLLAQNNDTNVVKSPEKSDSLNVQKWTNPVERFVGVWSLERTSEDAAGKEIKIYPGTFMVVHPNASYTIFVATDMGAVITSQGIVLIESTNILVEVISQHVNSSLVGVSNRIDYKLGSDYLYKSFWVEKDKYGDEYERQVKETWKRAKMPVVGEYDDSEAFPI